jgi:hypothetical protein
MLQDTAIKTRSVKEWQEIIKLILTSGEVFNWANQEYYVLAVALVSSHLK